MAKNILNVAVIGVSPAMGQIHMDGIKDIPGIHIYAICDTASDHITYYKEDEKDDFMNEAGARKISATVNNHNTHGEGQMFADALLHGKDVPIVAMEGAKSVAVALAIIESAKQGKAVQIKYPEV